jgi:hypothetical protein
MFGYTMNISYMNLTILKNKILLTLVTKNLQNQKIYYLSFISSFGNISPIQKNKRLLTRSEPIFNYIKYLTINIWNTKNSKFLNV